jgi:hypothetical protein
MPVSAKFRKMLRWTEQISLCWVSSYSRFVSCQALADWVAELAYAGWFRFSSCLLGSQGASLIPPDAAYLLSHPTKLAPRCLLDRRAKDC